MMQIASDSANVIPFAVVIETDTTLMPYSSHKNVPTVNTATMPHDRSRAERVCQIFQTCGTKEAVVSVPAMRPNVSAFISIVPSHLCESQFRELDLFTHALRRSAAHVLARRDRAFESQ